MLQVTINISVNFVGITKDTALIKTNVYASKDLTLKVPNAFPPNLSVKKAKDMKKAIVYRYKLHKLFAIIKTDTS